MTEQIFVALLDEDVHVWRPVDAEKLGDGTYRIASTLDPAALDEKWQFPPGATVVCQPRDTADGKIIAAVRLARAAG
ncbi:MAG TPA: hypothetical protein VFE47_10215 [Tepidisphaeraceae bacterium]|jgi:hypothetical protein|nr:hypothetical protein [Tepidisphaeraceae bacterium]